MKQLYVAWQDEGTRQWFPVGMLTNEHSRYQFSYLRGAEKAAQTGRFSPFPSFPDLNAVYEDTNLFPLFANRVMPRSRREYKDYVQWLALPKEEDDPMALLTRSGGRSATDSLEIYPHPEKTAEGVYHVHFFVHGVRYMTPEAMTLIDTLLPETRLMLMQDLQNSHDSTALLLRTDGEKPGDKQMVGYCPRYLTTDLHRLLREPNSIDFYEAVVVKVERVNPPPVPIQLRLLCSLTMHWPAGFAPFSELDYQTLAGSLAAA